MVGASLLCGIGKQVLSGDCIVIRERGPPTSRTIILSNIICPKIAKRPIANATEGTCDEPFGWIAREFVRSKVVGKEVCYTIENEQSSDRAYGSVFLGTNAGAENLTHVLVSEGLASVRKNMSQAMIDKNPALQALIELEEKAKTENKGIWSGSPIGRPRNVSWVIEDPATFFQAHARKPLRAIVEFVRDGSAMQVQLMPIDGDPSDKYYNFMVILSGIKTPGSKMVDNQRVHDPFSLEAQFFVESRLLQREVTVILESLSNQMFVGSILHPNGNIARFLLREGLAKCLEWNLAVVSPEAGGPQAYRDEERAAKEKRLRIWHDYQPASVDAASKGKAAAGKSAVNQKGEIKTEYTGMVVEIGMGDNILVKCQDGVVRKFFLSSIRPPRPNANEGKPQQLSRPLYQVPHMYEARELLRKRAIGKHVHLVVDYVQPKPEGSTMDDRVCATVTIGDTNLAEVLVQRGLANVVRYRNPTDARSRAYDALLAAEALAQKKLLGLFDPKPAAVHRFAELDGNADKSRQFLFSLQRSGPSEALIEFVSSASRFRVQIYRENLLCLALAAGIVSPRASRKLPNNTEEAGEPFGDEARIYTRDLIMHRELKFEVDSMDRVGNLIGWFTLPSEVKVIAPKSVTSSTEAKKKGGKKSGASYSSANLSVVLVARGYATVNRSPASQRANHYNTLLKAEQFAQEQRLGMWSSEEFRNNWDAARSVDHGDRGSEDQVANESSGDVGTAPKGIISMRELQKALPVDLEATKKDAAARLKSANLAQVTTISPQTAGDNSLNFFVQWNKEAGLMNTMNRELNSPNFPSANAVSSFQPRKNLVCAARFSADNLWYRARVLRYDDKTVNVVFIDFGNEEVVDRETGGASRLAMLPKNLSSQVPLATKYRLACVQLPPESEDRNAALACFVQSIGEQDIRVSPVTIPCGKDASQAPSAVVYVTGGANSSTAASAASEFIDVGEELLRDGLVFTESCRMPLDMAIRYSQVQQEAMRVRRNIWRYGDFREEDME